MFLKTEGEREDAGRSRGKKKSRSKKEKPEMFKRNKEEQFICCLVFCTHSSSAHSLAKLIIIIMNYSTCMFQSF